MIMGKNCSNIEGRPLLLCALATIAIPLMLARGIMPAMAQTGHAAHQVGVSAATAGIITNTSPLDDSVLGVAPSLIGLDFDRQVRLVKLVLYNERRDWVDIGFRYSPRPSSSFSLSVPALLETDYYTADWAILDDGDRLVRGSFSFTWGDGSERPSTIKERERIRLESSSAMPGLQELEDLGLDPAEIIINDGNPPRFEPPFAPILN